MCNLATNKAGESYCSLIKRQKFTTGKAAVKGSLACALTVSLVLLMLKQDGALSSIRLQRASSHTTGILSKKEKIQNTEIVENGGSAQMSGMEAHI